MCIMYPITGSLSRAVPSTSAYYRPVTGPSMTRDFWTGLVDRLGLRKKVKDGNLPVIYQGQKKGV